MKIVPDIKERNKRVQKSLNKINKLMADLKEVEKTGQKAKTEIANIANYSNARRKKQLAEVAGNPSRVNCPWLFQNTGIVINFPKKRKKFA